MAEERVQRRLAAILAADVVGYSRLVREDEEGTLAAVKSDIAEAFDPNVTTHNGRIFKTMGDGLLAEFASVVDAVRCAVEVQRSMAVRNAARSQDRKIEFRIGINLGDVVAEGGDLHGDGVNVSARLEGLADPGGIFISGTAFDHIQKNVDVGYEFLGEQEVKNIADPVRVYRVLTGPGDAGKLIGVTRKSSASWKRPAIAACLILVVAAAGALAWWQPWKPDVEPASIDKMAFKLPDKPSIAVLPFANMTGDKEQEYFADGLTEDIITSLASFPNLFVIARNSTAKFKGKAVDIRDVAHDLGVRYVLEGSVRRAGNTVRITAQLIDALSGNHMWAQSYDREIKDIFALQDEVTGEIGSRLVSKVVAAEYKRRLRKGTRNTEAYDLLLRGRKVFREFNPRASARAIQMIEQAVEKDPKFARAYAFLALLRGFNVRFRWAKGPKNTLSHAMELAQKAVALDPRDSMPYRAMSRVYRWQGQNDRAIEAAEKAIALSPSDPEGLINLALILAFTGRGEDAVRQAEKAMRLNPHGPWRYPLHAGFAYYMTKQFDKAAAAFDRARKLNPRTSQPLLWSAIAYAQLGKMEQARTAREEYLKVRPRFSIRGWMRRSRSKGAYRALILEGLRKAGFPESPPLKLPDKPSIAVLPFTNMSDDKAQGYFSDGITEDIITDLSKVSGLFVIARNSSFKYRGKSVDVRNVARDLGVRHVLEGSVRRSADQLRVTVQLVDATTGGHIWAERYDRELKDVFAIQDEIAAKVVTALQVALTEGEQARIWRKQTDNPEAYLHFLRGKDHLRHVTKTGYARAQQEFDKAVALEPNFATAWADLARIHFIRVRFGWSKDRAQSLARADELAQKALSIDDSQAGTYAILSIIARQKRKFEEVEAYCKKALALGPNESDTTALCAFNMVYLSRPEEALELIKRAMRLSPYFPGWYWAVQGIAYRSLQRYDDAIRAYQRFAKISPNSPIPSIGLVITYAAADRGEEARATAADVLKRNPTFSAKRFAEGQPYQDPAKANRLFEYLRKAGLPE